MKWFTRDGQRHLVNSASPDKDGICGAKHSMVAYDRVMPVCNWCQMVLRIASRQSQAAADEPQRYITPPFQSSHMNNKQKAAHFARVMGKRLKPGARGMLDLERQIDPSPVDYGQQSVPERREQQAVPLESLKQHKLAELANLESIERRLRASGQLQPHNIGDEFAVQANEEPL